MYINSVPMKSIGLASECHKLLLPPDSVSMHGNRCVAESRLVTQINSRVETGLGILDCSQGSCRACMLT